MGLFFDDPDGKKNQKKTEADRVREAIAAGKERDYDTKTVFKPDRDKNDIYFGGYGKPDGPGHGHVIVDSDGETHHVRDVYDGTEQDRKDAVVFDDGKYL